MHTLRQIVTVALAFVGIIVGAGFASGQEVMQYFVAFGPGGLWGGVASAVVMSVMAMIILQLGSYFNADQHGDVFRRVSHPIFSRILDIGVVITLFSTGFVMFAGAGSNLNQQWGAPMWVGAVLMVVLVLAAGMLDVDRVTAVIGAITPAIIVLLSVASVYVLAFTDHAPAEQLHQAAAQVGTTLPNWGVAAVNYVGFNLMVAVSMAVVIGGRMFHPRVAGRGGLLGGLIYSALLLLSTWTLYSCVDRVGGDDVPMLSIINELSPQLGWLMALVVYGMIFNTALGMFYALAKRLSARDPQHFRRYYIVTVLIGFALSFLGFRTLVGAVYPILGYIGLLLIAVMVVAWVRGRSRILQEASRRRRITDLLQLRDDPTTGWEPAQQHELRVAVKESNLDGSQIAEAVDREG